MTTKCSRCGGTEQVQRTLMPEVPALCIRCIETERGDRQAMIDVIEMGWEHEEDARRMEELLSPQQIVENRLW